jgi:predicted small lipoprotein YifL
MIKTSRLMPWIALLAVAFAAGGLGACGVKGALQPPPEAKADGTAKSADSADAGDNSAAKPKPHDNFILDPLLR